jgi:hypothetical protein
LEHVRDPGIVSRLLSPVDLDDVPGLYADIPARGVVRKSIAPILIVGYRLEIRDLACSLE